MWNSVVLYMLVQIQNLCTECLCISLFLWLQRGQSELLPGKFVSLEAVEQYEQQWHSLYETSTSDLGKKVCVCAYVSVH